MFNKMMITGHAGFIGSNFLDYAYEKKLAKHFILIDAGLTGSNLGYVRHYSRNENCTMYKRNLADSILYSQLAMGGHDDIDCIVNFAAESHVDRSIDDGIPFIKNNVLAIGELLEFARDLKNLKVFLQFSTDEVMGQRVESGDSFKPYDRKTPRNVYSASKSCQEEMAFGYAITHGVPLVTTRCTNIYGPNQFPEKLLPVIIHKLYNGEKIPVYGQGLQEREWVYVGDVCWMVSELLRMVTEDGPVDSTMAHDNIFHLGSMKPIKNIDFVSQVIKTYFEMTNRNSLTPVYPQAKDHILYVRDRKGHDFRYDMNCASTHSVGLVPKVSLDEGLRKTISWYLDGFKQKL